MLEQQLSVALCMQGLVHCAETQVPFYEIRWYRQHEGILCLNPMHSSFDSCQKQKYFIIKFQG